MDKRKAIQEAIAALKPIASSRPRISFVFVVAAPDKEGIFETLVDMGGTTEVTLYEKADEDPYVIESVEVLMDGVEVHCQKSRLVGRRDKKSGEGRSHHNCFVATDLA